MRKDCKIKRNKSMLAMYVLGYRISEVAKLFGISQSTARNAMSNMLRQMQVREKCLFTPCTRLMTISRAKYNPKVILTALANNFSEGGYF